MNDWHDPLEAPSPATVQANLPRLLAETYRVVEQAEHLAARLRLHQMQVGAALAALTGQQPVPAPATTTPLGIELNHRLWGTLETAISRLQAAHPGMTIDDCCNAIFEAGLRRLGDAADPAGTSP